ncbi:hypothetical protein LOK49_LG10G00831 [Camellia lanceoleosa]|uniref:Uncharacterized protein n=1 Tax=Camellia lanceoleosa TaxID=1840588 RepID=A0ACC0GCE0_9ERIC|nr:hypothetical protein LOK49_LG10G00831 [Camellia lanceoleosa]
MDDQPIELCKEDMEMICVDIDGEFHEEKLEDDEVNDDMIDYDSQAFSLPAGDLERLVEETVGMSTRGRGRASKLVEEDPLLILLLNGFMMNQKVYSEMFHVSCSQKYIFSFQSYLGSPCSKPADIPLIRCFWVAFSTCFVSGIVFTGSNVCN